MTDANDLSGAPSIGFLVLADDPRWIAALRRRFDRFDDYPTPCPTPCRDGSHLFASIARRVEAFVLLQFGRHEIAEDVRLLERLRRLDTPTRVIAALRTEHRDWAPLIRELGALHIAYGVRDLGPAIAAFARRSAEAPSPEMGPLERIEAALPWGLGVS